MPPGSRYRRVITFGLTASSSRRRLSELDLTTFTTSLRSSSQGLTDALDLSALTTCLLSSSSPRKLSEVDLSAFTTSLLALLPAGVDPNSVAVSQVGNVIAVTIEIEPGEEGGGGLTDDEADALTNDVTTTVSSGAFLTQLESDTGLELERC